MALLCCSLGFDFSVGIRVFVIELSQISFFDSLNMCMYRIFNVCVVDISVSCMYIVKNSNKIQTTCIYIDQSAKQYRCYIIKGNATTAMLTSLIRYYVMSKFLYRSYNRHDMDI